jgi:hexosaminidase
VIASVLLLVNLLPMPASVEMRAGQLKLGLSFEVKMEGHSDARLMGGIDRFKKRFPRGGIRLIVRCEGPGQAVQGIDEDESYSLDVGPEQAVLQAHTVVGVLRGLETLRQLYVPDGAFFQAAIIKDKPRFPWRGLLIDVCRHWEPVEVIQRNLDGMAAAKLNVFHWHLTEDQGFRIESKRYPKLQEMGSDGNFYTQDQVREIVAYARDRGIRVVPEFDMPGHTTAWLVGYPELAAAPGPYQIERKYGVFDGAFDPTRDEVYEFLDGFLGEMAALFPDAYLHIGGDENNGKQWTANPKIVAFRKEHGLADNHALQAFFNRRLLEILTKYNKRMIGWDEILHPDLPRDIVVQSWRGGESLSAGAKQGYLGILSAGYYLDHILPAAKHYEVDPLPAGNGLSEAEAARILGGEACMWGEQVTPETIDSRIWPRLGAIAERLWSPREVSDIPGMYRRLDAFSLTLEEVGLKHLSERDVMLKRLMGSNDIAALQMLDATLKPVTFGLRSRVKITQEMPLTGLVDATPPDSREGRKIIALIEGGAANRADLIAIFSAWQKLPPLPPEAEVLAVELRAMGRLGETALAVLAGERPLPAKWKQESAAVLDHAARPQSLVEFTIIPAMRKLVVTAAETRKSSQ